MKQLDSNILCPSCHEALKPRLLVCDACEIRVEGQFRLNEFATLAPEDLHFLRIFVRCEGRIREMESALGLSYPTIRSRLNALKTKLGGADAVVESAAPPEPKGAGEAEKNKVLERLGAGEISFDEAMKQIKRKRP